MKILVTGGASGLGLSITKVLAGNPANQVYFSYCKSEIQAKELMNEYANVSAVYCDFTKEDSLNQFLAYISTVPIDVLINNAYPGPLRKETYTKTQPENWSKGFMNNIYPTLRITQSLIQQFKQQQSGRIITVLSSVISGTPVIGWSQYYAEKMYLHAMVRSWAKENIAYHITSNSVSPSYMNTAIHGNQEERFVQLLESQHPLKKLLKTEEVADIISYLVSCTRQLNGVDIPVQAS